MIKLVPSRYGTVVVGITRRSCFHLNLNCFRHASGGGDARGQGFLAMLWLYGNQSLENNSLDYYFDNRTIDFIVSISTLCVLTMILSLVNPGKPHLFLTTD